MRLEPVIGLEMHLQLKTKSKMFCGCDAHTHNNLAPNIHVCPICLGHPGTMPVPNVEAIRLAILLGLAIEGQINQHSKFDRKHYFYPDLPKGYQITQYDLPVVVGGHLNIEGRRRDGEAIARRVGIVRAHLEEDAAKNIHADATTLIDFNRAGVPLLETVTEPDLRSPEEAKAFLQEFRLLVRTLGLSDGDMEKGHLRCDANISLRPVDEHGDVIGAKFHPKTEIKNINSFRNVERALQYEIQRQTKLWDAGTPPHGTTTRGFDNSTGATFEQRVKEEAADYRYFPEPDIPPMDLTELIEEMRSHLPELPAAKRKRFVDEYGFAMPDARLLVEDPGLADFAEQTISELDGWLESQSDVTPEDVPIARAKLTKLLASWLINKLPSLMNAEGIDVRSTKVTPENFAELLTLISKGKLTQANALKVLSAMLTSGADPTHVMEDLRLGKMDDLEALANAIDNILANHPEEVARYRGGELQLLKLFIGLVMKETEGSADPGATKNILLVKLEKE